MDRCADTTKVGHDESLNDRGPRGAKSLITALCVALLFGCATATLANEQGQPPWAAELEGYASWYGGKFQGRMTANGEIFDTNKLTAAHKTLPFNTLVEVTHSGNGRSVVVRINDRGPFIEGRVIDLSRAAADAIGMTGEGIAHVRLEVLSDQAAEEQLRSIQIASYRRKSSADHLVYQLQRAGVEAVVEHAEHPEHSGGVYRVAVIDIAESEVDAMEDRLADLGFEDVLIRSR